MFAVCVCVRACVRACVCVRACERALSSCVSVCLTPKKSTGGGSETVKIQSPEVEIVSFRSTQGWNLSLTTERKRPDHAKKTALTTGQCFDGCSCPSDQIHC